MPTPSIDPWDPGFGNCVQGQSLGNSWDFSVLGNFGEAFGTVPAVARSATAMAMANAWANTINNTLTLPNYMAIPYNGNCFILLDQNFDRAYIRVRENGTVCTPDTGTVCPFGMP